MKTFPPAALVYYTHLTYHLDLLANDDPEALETLKRELAQSLKNAVLTHGYLPAFYAYADYYPYAHNISLHQDDDMLTSNEALSERLIFLKKCFENSERILYIDETKKAPVLQQIKSLEYKEGLKKKLGALLTHSDAGLLPGNSHPLEQTALYRILFHMKGEVDQTGKLLPGELPDDFYVNKLSRVNKLFQSTAHALLGERRKTYPLETARILKLAFIKLPFEMDYHHTRLRFDYRASGKTNEHQIEDFCFHITCTGDTTPLRLDQDLTALQHQFQQAKNVYCYSKKVILESNAIVSRVENQVLIHHADVAILGMIMLIESKHSAQKWRNSQITALLDFLREARDLPETTWQWEGTYQRLQTFLTQLDLEVIKQQVQKTSSATVRPSLSPKNGRVLSVKLTSPRKLSNSDALLHECSLPSSPRGAQTSGESALSGQRRDSGSVLKIPDDTTTSAGPGRSRSKTSSNLIGRLTSKK